MNRWRKYWHKRGHHWFNVPLEIVEKTRYDISNKNQYQEVRRIQVVDVYIKKRCEHCNKRKLVHDKSIERRTARI